MKRSLITLVSLVAAAAAASLVTLSLVLRARSVAAHRAAHRHPLDLNDFRCPYLEALMQ